MKRYSGWLAAGLVLFAVLACNLSKNSNNSNNSNSNSNKNSNANTQPTRPANADVYIDKISTAKDDNGKPGETSLTFDPSDHTIHCVVDLNKPKAGTKVKFVWKAIDVPTEKNEDIRTIDYSTKSFEDKVHAHLTLPRDWPKGTYGIDVFINGALDKTIKYTVE
jgi:hypothetical protein